jgi:hypothetical protein
MCALDAIFSMRGPISPDTGLQPRSGEFTFEFAVLAPVCAQRLPKPDEDDAHMNA